MLGGDGSQHLAAYFHFGALFLEMKVALFTDSGRVAAANGGGTAYQHRSAPWTAASQEQPRLGGGHFVLEVSQAGDSLN